MIDSELRTQNSELKKGFTLIELLVVIAIISVMTALALPNFVSARERARDTQRKSDIRQIQKALELYKQDQTLPSYPATGDSPFTLADCGAIWQVGATIYMAKMPCDPLLSIPYTYVRAFDPSRYTLSVCLENASDPDSVPWAGCTSGRMYQVREP